MSQKTSFRRVSTWSSRVSGRCRSFPKPHRSRPGDQFSLEIVTLRGHTFPPARDKSFNGMLKFGLGNGGDDGINLMAQGVGVCKALTLELLFDPVEEPVVGRSHVGGVAGMGQNFSSSVMEKPGDSPCAVSWHSIMLQDPTTPGQMWASTHHSMPEMAQDIQVDVCANAQPPRNELAMNDTLLVKEANQHHTLLTQGCARLVRASGVGLQPLGSCSFGCWIIGHEPTLIPCHY